MNTFTLSALILILVAVFILGAIFGCYLILYKVKEKPDDTIVVKVVDILFGWIKIKK